MRGTADRQKNKKQQSSVEEEKAGKWQRQYIDEG